MHIEDRHEIVERIFAEANADPRDSFHQKVLLEWRLKLAKEPAFQIDQIVRAVWNRLKRAAA